MAARRAAVTLPDWQAEIVARGELYRVGGAVRDRLLGLPGNPDTDLLVRGLPPEELERILARHGRLVYVGKAFGVYKFNPANDDDTYDIVFPRTETSTGPGHREFDVHWDWRLPVEDDLRRRDFTINAIAERIPDGRRVDPFDGAGDLARRKLRTIFERAFVEDPLRILRAARFTARFGLDVDADTRARMRESAALVATVSAERIRDECTKTMTQCDRTGAAWHLLSETGSLVVFLPELSRCAGVVQNEYHPDDVYWHSLKTCDAAPRENLLVRWAALLHDTGKVDARQTVTDERGARVVFYGHELQSADITVAVLERLRYPASFVDACRRLVRHHMYRYAPEWRPATVRRFMRTVGADLLEDLFLLREADCRSRADQAGMDLELERLGTLRRRVDEETRARAVLRVQDLDVDGEDVMRSLGIGPGPEVGRVLERLLERVIESPSDNQRPVLLAWLEQERKRL
jgi:poly(A) polymerase/tRNA nucleotidyltransferase (CCA-adding enzyme)